jgi:hypothetical protein
MDCRINFFYFRDGRINCLWVVIASCKEFRLIDTLLFIFVCVQDARMDSRYVPVGCINARTRCTTHQGENLSLSWLFTY